MTESSPRRGGNDLALDEDVIAEVHEGLPLRERLLTDVGQAQHDLQPHGFAVQAALLEGGEAEFARVADEDDAAGHANGVAGGFIGLQVGVFLPDFRERVRAFDTHRICLDAAFDQLGALLHADAGLFAGIMRLGGVVRGGGVLGSHNPQVYRRFASGKVPARAQIDGKLGDCDFPRTPPPRTPPPSRTMLYFSTASLTRARRRMSAM